MRTSPAVSASSVTFRHIWNHPKPSSSVQDLPRNFKWSSRLLEISLKLRLRLTAHTAKVPTSALGCRSSTNHQLQSKMELRSPKRLIIDLKTQLKTSRRNLLRSSSTRKLFSTLRYYSTIPQPYRSLIGSGTYLENLRLQLSALF